MDDRRVGRLLRAARHRRRWRQIELERRAGVDQTTISLIERGRVDGLTVRTVRRVADALGVRLELAPRMSVAEATALLDEGHAALVERVVTRMRADGWETTAEYTFNHFGDRGSVDVIGWHTAHRALLIVEVKTVLVDVQDVLAALDRKCRVVPPLLARDRGWRARAVGRMLVVRDATAARTVVRRHARTFDSVLPRRATDAREWLRAPGGPIGAVWFMSGTNVGRTRRGARGSAAPG